MTAAAGFPTLRLIRARIGDWFLDNLTPGQWREEKVPEAMQALLSDKGPIKRRRKPHWQQ